jgi:hypothetical protein
MIFYRKWFLNYFSTWRPFCFINLIWFGTFSNLINRLLFDWTFTQLKIKLNLLSLSWWCSISIVWLVWLGLIGFWLMTFIIEWYFRGMFYMFIIIWESFCRLLSIFLVLTFTGCMINTINIVLIRKFIDFGFGVFIFILCTMKSKRSCIRIN